MKLFILNLLSLIVLAGPVHADVTSAQRALIVITELDSTGIPELAPLYTTLEGITLGLPNLPVVNASYQTIVSLRNGNATMSALRQQMRALTSRNDILAVDVILALHGKDNKLKFRDGTVKMEDLQSFMLEGDPIVVQRMKRKLRLMYNTSCFGESHRQAFRTIGFDVVIGAVGVNANSEAEYPSFLALWNAGQSVSTSLAPTNNAAALAVTDGPLVASGRFLNNFLKNVNSKKLTAGNVNIRISTPAQ